MKPIVLHIFDERTVELECQFDSFESFSTHVSHFIRGRRSPFLFKYLDVDSEWVTFDSEEEFRDIPLYCHQDNSQTHILLTDSRFEERKKREVAKRLRRECGDSFRRRAPWSRFMLHEMLRRDLSPSLGDEGEESDRQRPCRGKKGRFFSYFGENSSNPFLKIGNEYCRQESPCFKTLMLDCMKHLCPRACKEAASAAAAVVVDESPKPTSPPEISDQAKLEEALVEAGHCDVLLNRRLLFKYEGDLDKTKKALEFIESLL